LEDFELESKLIIHFGIKRGLNKSLPAWCLLLNYYWSMAHKVVNDV